MTSPYSTRDFFRAEISRTTENVLFDRAARRKEKKRNFPSHCYFQVFMEGAFRRWSQLATEEKQVRSLC